MTTVLGKQRSATAEIFCDGVWREIEIEQARRAAPGVKLRCIACHGQVAAHGAYTARKQSYLQHRRPHDGCPFLHTRFEGTLSRHPQALA